MISVAVVSMPARNNQSDQLCFSGEDFANPDTMLSIPPPKPSRGKFSFARIKAKRIPFIDKMAALESRGFLCNALVNSKGSVSKIDIINTNTYFMHSIVVEENGDVPPCSDDSLEDDISDELDSAMEDIPYEGVSNEEAEILCDTDNVSIALQPDNISDQTVGLTNFVMSDEPDETSSGLTSTKVDDELKSEVVESCKDTAYRDTMVLNSENTDSCMFNGTCERKDIEIPKVNGVCDKTLLSSKTVKSKNETESRDTKPACEENEELSHKSNESVKTKPNAISAQPKVSEINVKTHAVQKLPEKNSVAVRTISESEKQNNKDKLWTHPKASKTKDNIPDAYNSGNMVKAKNTFSSTSGHFIAQSKSFHDSKISDETEVVKLCITHAMPIKVREKFQRAQILAKVENGQEAEKVQKVPPIKVQKVRTEKVQTAQTEKVQKPQSEKSQKLQN